ncbi:MAG: MFS transporter [Dehalococcoidia bacterium]|nr:MAG: MFS transporter [Dehalococcoidia bacterium]
MSDLKPVPPGEGELEVLPPEQARVTTFTSLKNRHYRWFWLGMLASFIGIHLQLVARNWLVYEMTGSALALGIVIAAWGLPILLLSLYGGAVADRVKKRDLLIVTQVANGIITLIIAILIATEGILLWHLIAAAALTGIIFAFHVPARLAIIPELVQKREILNAIALNSTGMNLSRFVGFAIGGALLGVIGVAGVYYVVVFCFFVSAALLFMLPVVEKVRQRAVTSIKVDMMEGLRYIYHSPLLRSLLAMAFVSIAFGLPYMNLMPVFAVDIFDVGEFGLGFLLGMAGLGSLIGSLILASLGDFRRKGLLCIGLAFGFGATVALFGFSDSYPLSLVLLIAVGLLGAGYLAVNNTLIQSKVPHEMLGRVMSIYVMTFAMMPLGTLPLGAVSEAIGAQLAIGAGGIIVVLFTLGMAIFHPRLRRLE